MIFFALLFNQGFIQEAQAAACGDTNSPGVEGTIWCSDMSGNVPTLEDYVSCECYTGSFIWGDSRQFDADHTWPCDNGEIVNSTICVKETNYFDHDCDVLSADGTTVISQGHCFCMYQDNGSCSGTPSPSPSSSPTPSPPPSGCNLANCQSYNADATYGFCYSGGPDCSNSPNDVLLNSLNWVCPIPTNSCHCCAPSAISMTAVPVSGVAPLVVNFTLHVDRGTKNSWTLDFGDGASDSGSGNPDGVIRQHTYNLAGYYNPVFTSEGSTATTTITVNLPPLQNLRKTQANTTSVVWAWDAVPGADSYSIYGGLEGGTEYLLSPSITNTTYTQTEICVGGACLWSNYMGNYPVPWNIQARLRVVARHDPLPTSEASKTASSAIELPNLLACTNNTNTGFDLQPQSNERLNTDIGGPPFVNWSGVCGFFPSAPFCGHPWFSNLNKSNSRVRIQVRTIANAVVQTSGWLGLGATSEVAGYNSTFGLPDPWHVVGLTIGTTYNIYAQARNQDASATLGDYRPGPNDTGWQSIGTCATTGAPVTCAPDAASACCTGPKTSWDATGNQAINFVAPPQWLLGAFPSAPDSNYNPSCCGDDADERLGANCSNNTTTYTRCCPVSAPKIDNTGNCINSCNSPPNPPTLTPP